MIGYCKLYIYICSSPVKSLNPHLESKRESLAARLTGLPRRTDLETRQDLHQLITTTNTKSTNKQLLDERLTKYVSNHAYANYNM